MSPDLPFEPRDRAAYLPAPDALVLADLHLGKGEAAAVELPLTGAVVDRVDALVDRFEPATVVLAGDVLHTFSRVSPAVVDSLAELRGRLSGVDLRVVAGNHDGRLASLCEAAVAGDPDGGDVSRPRGGTPPPVDVVDHHRLDDGTVVCHGHEAPDAGADRYVVGHDHPAIVIEGKRRPCYLYGEGAFEGADVLALPAFNPLATGTAVNRLDRHDPASPLLADVGSFRPVVWDEAAEETFVFPPLSSSGAFL